MKKKYQNGFFLFGLAVLVVMVSQLDFGEVWQPHLHGGLLVLGRCGHMGISLHDEHPVVVHHHPQRTAPEKPGKLLVALQDHHIRIRTQLCHPGRTDGRRALPHHVAYAQNRHREGIFIGHPLRHDAHLQPFLVLAAFRGALLVSLRLQKGLAVRVLSVLGHIPGIRGWIRRFVGKHRSQLDQSTNR